MICAAPRHLETNPLPAARPSFREVAETNLDAVVRYLAHMTRDRPLAEDLASATFERAIRDWHRYDPRRGRPIVWLLTIARQTALDHFRSERRRRDREARYAAEIEGASAAPEPRDAPDAALTTALAELTRGERELLALRVVLEFETAEAAAIAGLTPSAVSSGLHRALVKLREKMGDRHEVA